MSRKKKRTPKRTAPLLQIGASKDTVAVLRELSDALHQAIWSGREIAAQEIAKQIGELGGVKNVTVANSVFNGGSR